MGNEQLVDEGIGSRQMVMAREAPVAPKGITDDEAGALRARAAQVVGELRGASGSKEMEIIDSITAVGIQTQRHAGTDLELLRARVGDMITADPDGPGGRITRDLVDLRMTLDQIDPQRVRQENILQRVVHHLPFGRKRLLRVLETIAVRYEPVSRQVVVLETRLREGRMLLARDNIELRKLYEQAEAQREPVQRNAYLGELVMEQLRELLEETSDPQKRARVQDALYDVATRVQDLRVMEEVHLQLFVSLEMTWQNNGRLGQAVDRTLTLVSNVVIIGLAIQSALVRQKRVLEATERTREYLGNRLVANSSAIRQHTAEIGDVYSSPVVALEKIGQAHDNLCEAMDLADRLKADGIASARDNVLKLTRLAAQLGQRTADLGDQRAVPSLEA